MRDSETQVRVRHSEIFEEKPERAVAHKIKRGRKSVEGLFFVERPQNQKKHDSFKKRLVQLARMSRQIHESRFGNLHADFICEIFHPFERRGKFFRIRKNHSPRHFRNAPVKLAVQKISEPSESVAKRNRRAHRVRPFEKRPPVRFAPNEHSESAADYAAMIRHSRKAREAAAVERPKNQVRLFEIFPGSVVDERGKNPRADQKENYSRDDETRQIVFGGFLFNGIGIQRAFFENFFEHEIRRAERENVHQPVPTQNSQERNAGKNFRLDPRRIIYVKQIHFEHSLTFNSEKSMSF